MEEDSDFWRPRPSESDDEELLREVADLADARAARISAEEIEARLLTVFDQLQRVDASEYAAPLEATRPPDLATDGHGPDPVAITAHLQALEIVEVARREADARRREAHHAERYFAAVKEEAEKLSAAARVDAERTRDHALAITEQARARANWLLEEAEKARGQEASPPAELASASSSGCPPRRRPGPGARYEAGPAAVPARTTGPPDRPAETSPSASRLQREAGRRRWRRRWTRKYTAALVVVDALAATFAAVVAYQVRFAAEEAAGYLILTMAMPVLWVAVVALLDCYEPSVMGLGSEEYQRIGRAFIAATAVLGFVSYAFKLEVVRGYVVLALPLALVLCLLGRYAARKWLHRRRMAGHYLHNVIAVGEEHAVVDLVTQLRRDQYSGMRVVGACLSGGDGARLVGLGVPLLGGVDDVAEAVLGSGADTVAVAGGVGVDPARLRRLSWELEGSDTDLVVSPGLIEVAGPRLHIRPVSGLPLLHVEEPTFSGLPRILKGAFDRTAAAAALVLVLPLLLVIAASVKLTSPGPVVFRQTRTGWRGREFTLYKFRSMYADAEARAGLLARNERGEGLLFKIRSDPRVTPVGRWLRRFSLDELPQLVNILFGHMSLVGPRPPLPDEVALYEEDVRRRLLVKPGLTGLWQVSGRSDLTWEESVRLDLRYVENWSFALDLMILWKTGSAISRGRGAY